MENSPKRGSLSFKLSLRDIGCDNLRFGGIPRGGIILELTAKLTGTEQKGCRINISGNGTPSAGRFGK